MQIHNAICRFDEIIMTVTKCLKRVKCELDKLFKKQLNENAAKGHNQVTTESKKPNFKNHCVKGIWLERICNIHFYTKLKTSRYCEICTNSLSTANTVI